MGPLCSGKGLMRLTPLLALLALTNLACEQDRPTANLSTTVRDSAGIRIIENAEPPLGSRLGWTISPGPTVTIGVAEGDEPYMLYGAIDAARFDDGRIVVANIGTNELRVFDAAGTHLATWGGRGEGPGEFRSLWRVEPWPGDSIITWYAPRLGISVFDAQGNHGRSFTLAHNEAVTPMQSFRPEYATRDGSILAIHMPEDADTIVAQLRGAEGEVRSSLGTHPGMEPYIYREGERSMLFWTIFGRDPVWGTWGDLVVVGHTGSYELKAFRGDGSLARIVRRDHVPRATTEGDLEAYIERQISYSTLTPAAELRRRYESVPVAEHFPAFESVRSDAVNHLWVAEYEFSEEEPPPRLWTVFDPEGRALGYVETPEGLWIHEIGEDYVLGTTFDELDVEHVQLWGLERSDG